MEKLNLWNQGPIGMAIREPQKAVTIDGEPSLWTSLPKTRISNYKRKRDSIRIHTREDFG